MTEQKVDRAFYRDVAERYAGYGNPSIPAEHLLALLDHLEQAEADRDWNLRSSRLAKEERIEANARADEAEARIKAVRDVLDAWDRFEHHDSLEVGIRRALDLPYLGSPDECCGRGICALGQGHSGPCRC